jgi:hypothetical protein
MTDSCKRGNDLRPVSITYTLSPAGDAPPASGEATNWTATNLQAGQAETRPVRATASTT